MSDVAAETPAYAFTLQPGQTSWWKGDGAQFPYHHPGERHRYFITREDVLSPVQCQLLIGCFERAREKHAAQSGGDYWKGRFIWQNNLPESEIDAIRVMQQVRFLTLQTLNQAIRPSEPLYSDTAQLVRWHEGIELPPHVDKMEPDGRPNISPHRTFSSILYLNDDHEGGETFFPGHRHPDQADGGRAGDFRRRPRIRPRHHRVTRGLRYTYAGWFTYDRKFEDPNAPKVF